MLQRSSIFCYSMQASSMLRSFEEQSLVQHHSGAQHVKPVSAQVQFWCLSQSTGQGSGCVPRSGCSPGCQGPFGCSTETLAGAAVRCVRWWVQCPTAWCGTEGLCPPQRPGQSSKHQRLLPSWGTKPPAPVSNTSVPTLLHELRPQQTCAQVSQACASRGLSMQTHGMVLPRGSVSPRGGTDEKDVFVTQKVLVKH